jgi:hypothetical protein
MKMKDTLIVDGQLWHEYYIKVSDILAINAYDDGELKYTGFIVKDEGIEEITVTNLRPTVEQLNNKWLHFIDGKFE